MDIKLKNGDFALSENGRPITISGDQELLQRIENRLKLQKGSVFLKGDLGSELHLLQNCTADQIDGFAAECVRNALKGIREISVEDVKLQKEGDRIDITVIIKVLSKNLIYEVKI
ncbi:MAG: histidine kinase [Clostridia bacterium]|nr:histidine kinase [Clostridia bacterium]